jgi:hypothetical protein
MIGDRYQAGVEIATGVHNSVLILRRLLAAIPGDRQLHSWEISQVPRDAERSTEFLIVVVSEPLSGSSG